MSLLTFGQFLIRGGNSSYFDEFRLSSHSPTVSTTQDKRTMAEIKVVDFQENRGCYILKLKPDEAPLITIDYSTLLKTKEFWESLLRKSDFTYKTSLFIFMGILGWRKWIHISNQSLTPVSSAMSIAAALSSLVFAVFVIYRSLDIKLHPFPREMLQLAPTFNAYRRELFEKGLPIIRNVPSDSIKEIADSLLTTKEKEHVIHQYFTNYASKILSDLNTTTYQTWFDQNISPILDEIFKRNSNTFGVNIEMFGKDEPSEYPKDAYEHVCQNAINNSLSDALTYSELDARVDYQIFKYVPHLKAQMKEIFDSISDPLEAIEWLTGEIEKITDPKLKKIIVKALELENPTEPSPLNNSFL